MIAVIIGMVTFIIISILTYYYGYNGGHFCCWHAMGGEGYTRKIRRKFTKCQKSDSFIIDGNHGKYIECAILKKCCICGERKWTIGHRFLAEEATDFPEYVDGKNNVQ